MKLIRIGKTKNFPPSDAEKIEAEEFFQKHIKWFEIVKVSIREGKGGFTEDEKNLFWRLLDYKIHKEKAPSPLRQEGASSVKDSLVKKSSESRMAPSSRILIVL